MHHSRLYYLQLGKYIVYNMLTRLYPLNWWHLYYDLPNQLRHLHLQYILYNMLTRLYPLNW